ncbi:MAG: ABC transporter permease [Clostridia bacterium]|nr:ABC transporter permease [Clostridia bacterium]
MKQSVFQKVYLFIILLLMYIPMLLVVVYSFNKSNITTVWSGFSISWYSELFADREMAEALKNSIVIALITSALSAFLGTLAAVGIYKGRSALDRGIKKLASVPLMMPEIITGLLFLLIFSALGIRLGIFTIVVAHSSFCIPYVYMTVTGSLEQLDVSTTDAARDLGAGKIRTFFEITVPQLMPGIVSGALLSFAMSMDDVIISFFVTGPGTNTLPVKIYSQLKKGVTPEVNALCTLMLAVTVLIVVLAAVIGRKKRR